MEYHSGPIGTPRRRDIIGIMYRCLFTPPRVKFPVQWRPIITFWRTRKMKAPFVDPRLCFMPYPRYDILTASDPIVGDDSEDIEGENEQNG